MHLQTPPKIVQIDEYKVIKTLKDSVYPSVFLVQNQQKIRYVIKKFVLAQFEDFQKESNMCQVLNHQNLGKFVAAKQNVNCKQQNNHSYPCHILVTQYVEGKQLFDFKTRFSQQLARTLFHQLISGLSYMHSKGYNHQDLRPQNIIIEESTKKLVLVDYSFACRNQAQNPQFPQKSKKNKAPQTYQKQQYDKLKADIFSAGFILYLMCKRCYPFQSNLDCHRYKKSLDQKYLWKHQSFSKEFKSLFISMVKHAPNQRISIQQILSHPWMNKPLLTKQKVQKQINHMLKEQLKKLQAKKQQQQYLQQLKNKYKQEGHQSSEKRGIHEGSTFDQLYEYENYFQRQIEDLEPINLNDDLIVSCSLPYSFALLKDFFQNKSISLDEEGQFVLRGIDLKQQKQDRLEAKYQLKYQIENEEIQDETSLRVVFGRTKNSNLVLVITQTSGDRLYFKKVVQQIKYLFVLYLKEE